MRRRTALLIPTVVLAALVLTPSLGTAPPTVIEFEPAVSSRSVDVGPAPRLWRGRTPRMCLVRGCPASDPTFCMVRSNDAPQLKGSADQHLCDRDPHFRDAFGLVKGEGQDFRRFP